MLDVYNPKVANDPRFDDIYACFTGLEIRFVSGFAGWCWTAMLPNTNECGESCFLSLEDAVQNCRTVLLGEPKWLPSPFAGKIEQRNLDLADYLKNWTAEHG